MAKEHVEYSLVICVFIDVKCMIMPFEMLKKSPLSLVALQKCGVPNFDKPI